MSKTKKINQQVELRNSIINDNSISKIIENNKTIKSSYELKDKIEISLFTFIQSVINKQSVLTIDKKELIGLEFNYSKFLNVAINWNDGKNSISCNKVEIVKKLDRVFKKYFLEFASQSNVMPILFVTRENSIVIRLLKYNKEFYSVEKQKEKTEKKNKKVELIDIKKLCSDLSLSDIQSLENHLQELKKNFIKKAS